MSEDDALSRAKRALVVTGGRTVAKIDNAKVEDLLARARNATHLPPAVIAPNNNDLLARARAASRPVEPRPAATVQSPGIDGRNGGSRPAQLPAKTVEPLREAPHNPPTAIIAEEPGRTVARNNPQPAEPQTVTAPAQTVQQTTVVVQVAAPNPYPYPYWWGYPAGCGHWSCPLRRGLPCRRWGCW